MTPNEKAAFDAMTQALERLYSALEDEWGCGDHCTNNCMLCQTRAALALAEKAEPEPEPEVCIAACHDCGKLVIAVNDVRQTTIGERGHGSGKCSGRWHVIAEVKHDRTITPQEPVVRLTLEQAREIREMIGTVTATWPGKTRVEVVTVGGLRRVDFLDAAIKAAEGGV